MKDLLRNVVRRLASALQIAGGDPYGSSGQAVQRQLFFHYQALRNMNLPLPVWQETGFSVYSQCDEDGLLLYLFSLLGTTNKVCVDVAFASPYGANTTNLLCNWGWTGLLVEGASSHKRETEAFFHRHKGTCIYPPRVVSEWVTVENINTLMIENGISGEIDFFSLDMDGVDYWIWKAMDAIQPRVVMVEYQDVWGPNRSVTVPYKPDFDRFKINPNYCSASLPAFIKLAKEKDYRLVGCNRYGFNAFFVRSDIGTDLFPEIEAEQCFRHPLYKDGVKKVLPQIEKFEWVEV